MTSLVALTYTALREEEKGRELVNEHNCGVEGAPDHILLWMWWCESARCCVGETHPPVFAFSGQRAWTHLASFPESEAAVWRWWPGNTEVCGPQDGLSCGTRTVDTVKDNHVDGHGPGRHEKYSWCLVWVGGAEVHSPAWRINHLQEQQPNKD